MDCKDFPLLLKMSTADRMTPSGIMATASSSSHRLEFVTAFFRPQLGQKKRKKIVYDVKVLDGYGILILSDVARLKNLLRRKSKTTMHDSNFDRPLCMLTPSMERFCCMEFYKLAFTVKHPVSQFGLLHG